MKKSINRYYEEDGLNLSLHPYYSPKPKIKRHFRIIRADKGFIVRYQTQVKHFGIWWTFCAFSSGTIMYGFDTNLDKQDCLNYIHLYKQAKGLHHWEVTIEDLS